MLDLGASELLLIVIVAVIVIGPKDLPLAMRTAGRWMGKVRRVSGHFRTGIDAMIREAEVEEMEKKWKAHNEAIMAEHPDPDDIQAPVKSASAEAAMEPLDNKPGSESEPEKKAETERDPQLPLPPP